MLLAIGTAHRACSLALIDGERCVRNVHELIGRGHAERLVPMIADLMDGRRAHGILVDIGPGSFTGIRVGIAAARALALAWRVPVHGMSSMHLLAARAYASDPALGPLTVLLDGGRGEVFRQDFEDGRDCGDAVAVTATDVKITRGAVIGTGASLVPELAAPKLGEGPPHAADARLLRPEERDLPPTPLYVRAPDAKRPG